MGKALIHSFCIIFGFGLLAVQFVTAQDSNDLPPVLNPDEIFVEGVEIEAALPIVNSAIGGIYYFDPELSGWEFYRYPDPLFYAEIITRRSDEIYLMSNTNSNVENRYWIFDPESREIYRPTIMCARIQSLPGEGAWIIYRNPEDELLYLCFTEIGELLPISDDLQTELCEILNEPIMSSANTYTSPDQSPVLLVGCAANPYETGYPLYSYEIETNNVLFLGQSEPHESIEVVRWFDETTPIIFGTTLGDQHNRYIYKADLGQENSLQLIASTYVSEPLYFDNPPRYVWVSRRFEGSSGVAPHLVADVREYNLSTGEERVLLDGACQNYVSWCDAFPSGGGDNINYVAITEQIVQADTSTLSVFGVNYANATNLVLSITLDATLLSGYVEWSDTNTLIAFGGTTTMPLTGAATIIDLDLNLPTFTPIYNVDRFKLSPNKQYFARWDESSLTLNIYDISTGEEIPITYPIMSHTYLGFEWATNDILVVRWYDEDFPTGNPGHPFLAAVWHVRVF